MLETAASHSSSTTTRRREFAHDVGAEKGLAAAEANGWSVASMKGNFGTVF
jgi:hypothetical protein